MNEFKNIITHINCSVRQAMQIIDVGALKFAILLDDQRKLIGIITDGDIRRCLLKGATLDDTIENSYTAHPIFCKTTDSRNHILKLAKQKQLLYMPIIDENGILVRLDNVSQYSAVETKKNKVVLMVGGMGTRLRPLTDHLPKPMLKVGEKPILQTIIENFKKHGFHHFILSVSYKSEVIVEHFGDGAEFGVEIEYIYENKRMGTAGTLSFMKDQLTEPFFVMNGDLLTNINFEHMLEAHQQNNSLATMGVREYDYQVPYGVVKVDDNQITAIEEKPIQQFYVNGGIYVLDHKTLDLVPHDVFFDMPTLFEKAIENQMKTMPYPIREYWLDIGRLEEYEKANNEYSMVFKQQ